MATSTLSDAHHERPTCQPSRASPLPRATASATGTANRAGSEVPAVTPITYSEVTVAMRCGNHALTSTGSTTLPRPMPISATIEQATNAQGPPDQGRDTRPATSSASSASTTRSAGMRRSSRGPISPASAKQNGGSAPTRPACAGVRGMPALTLGRSGDRPVTAVRTVRVRRRIARRAWIVPPEGRLRGPEIARRATVGRSRVTGSHLTLGDLDR